MKNNATNTKSGIKWFEIFLVFFGFMLGIMGTFLIEMRQDHCRPVKILKKYINIL